MVSPEVFAYIDSLWGQHTVDRFANNFNTPVQLLLLVSGHRGGRHKYLQLGTGSQLGLSAPYFNSMCHQTCCGDVRKGDTNCAIMALSPVLANAVSRAKWFVRDMMFLASEQVLLPGRQGCILPACDLLAIAFDFSMGSSQ